MLFTFDATAQPVLEQPRRLQARAMRVIALKRNSSHGFFVCVCVCLGLRIDRKFMYGS